MKKLTLFESFDYLWSELCICSLNIREKSDYEIERLFFDEFAIGYPGAFSSYTRETLVDNGIISNTISILIEKLQNKLLEIESEGTQWNVESLKTSLDWEKILILSDEIKQLVKEKWDSEEIKALREG